MANNPILFNGAVQGATGGVYQRWITDNQSSNYIGIRNLIVQLANSIDALIPTDPTVSSADGALMQSLVQGVFAERFLYTGMDFNSIAQTIAILYGAIRGQLTAAGFIPIGDLQPIAPATLIGRARGAGIGVPSALTETQIAAIIDQAAISWANTQRFLGNIQYGTQQNESGALPLNGTINNGTNRWYLLVAGDGEIQTLTPASGTTDVGRIIECYIVGNGTKVFRHAFSGGGIGRIQCPNNVDWSAGNRASFQLVGDGANGWLLMNGDPATNSITLNIAVPAVSALTLAYLDRTLVGTPFERLPTNTQVVVAPQADLQAAALNAGFCVGARMSATSTLRFAFYGQLTGGATNFTITKLP